MNMFMVYLFCKLEAISVLVCVGSFLFVASKFFYLCIYSDSLYHPDEEEIAKLNSLKKSLIKSIPICSLIFIFGIMIPDKKEMATIIILPKLANSEFLTKEVPEDFANLYDLAKDYVKEKLSTEND